MSHFSTIKTKIKEKPILLEALQLLGHDIKEDQELVVGNVYHAKDHPIVQADVCIGTDIGFRWNASTDSYELVTDLDLWDQKVPIESWDVRLDLVVTAERIYRSNIV